MFSSTWSAALVENQSGHMPQAVDRAKRCFDVLAALLGLSVTLPLLPVLILAIKLDSRGPVFFRQLRVGRARPGVTEIFWMIKFRSMGQDAETKSGAVWAQKVDPRVTRVGKFMRKTRLDEIPQLINVLRGEMSLVGPRPERPQFYQKLETAIPLYAERTYGLRPGITGLAQVYQGYDETVEDVRRKVGFDHSYAAALSDMWNWISMDLLVIWRTIWVVLFGRGQ